MKTEHEATQKTVFAFRCGYWFGALLNSKFTHSFSRCDFFAGIALTQSLKKIKTCRRSRKIEALFLDKVFVPFFKQSLARVFSIATKEIGEKLASKLHDKVEQEI